ncbi:MAG TPA: sugar ABC transporter substrate-binding protein [bacterium]|nr:sugar ABC transporter substrate-binding protein [bacterium]
MVSGIQRVLLSRRGLLKGATAAAVALSVPALAPGIRRVAEAAAGAVTLNVWASPDNADALADIANRFTVQNPAIRVTVTPISWEVLYPRMLADVASGTGAFDVATWDVQTAGAVSKGFVDLGAFRTAHPDLVDPSYDLKDFDPGVWHVGGVWQGKNIGIPFYNNTMLLYYRKDYFGDTKLQSAFQAKYNRPLAVPKTWKEAVSVSEFFTKSKNPSSPTSYGMALMFPRTHTLFYMYVLYFADYRRDPAGIRKWGPVDLDYGDFFSSQHTPAFGTPEGVAAIKDMMTLMPFSPDPLGSDYGETIEYFTKGTVAMVPQWTGVWASFKTAQVLQPLGDKVGTAVMPGGHSCSGIWGLGINRATKQPNEAFKFLQWATNKDNDKTKFMKFGVAPSRISSLKDPAVLQADPRVPALLATYPQQGYRPRIPVEPKLEDITLGTFSEVLGGRRPATVATLSGLAGDWTSIIKSGA